MAWAYFLFFLYILAPVISKCLYLRINILGPEKSLGNINSLGGTSTLKYRKLTAQGMKVAWNFFFFFFAVAVKVFQIHYFIYTSNDNYII